MSLTIRYENVQSTLSSIGSNAIRMGALVVQQSAQVGEPAISENRWDDDAGAWLTKGYREFWISESAAPVNDQLVYRGFVQSRTITRAQSQRTTLARTINVETADENWALGARILYDGSGAGNAKRPAETAGDRIRWLVNSSAVLPSLYAHPTIFANPSTAMDANDYRGQRYNDVLGDIANVTGYNFFVQYSEVRSRVELLFMDPNGSSYPSTISISNVLSDVNGNHNTVGTVFAPSEDADLHIDPSRIAADAYVPYDGGAVFVSRASTAATFTRISQAAPTANIHTAAKATALANRYLDDNDEEDERVGCSIVVPASQVNDLRQGMRTYATFSHFPGWETPRPCRVLKRTVVQDEAIGQNAYRIDLELSPTGASALSCSAAVSARVTASISDQPNLTNNVSLGFTLTSDAQTIALAAAVSKNNNVPTDSDMVATGSWSTMLSVESPSGHPTVGIFKRSITGAGSYTVTGSYTPGFSPGSSVWGVVAAAFQSNATEPVQEASDTFLGLSDLTVTLGAAPTVGNMLVMTMALRAVPGTPAPPELATGWTLLDHATAEAGIGTDSITMWVRCVAPGDAAGPWGAVGLSHEAVVHVAEWAF